MVNFIDSEKLKEGRLIYDHKQITDFSDILKKKIELFFVTAEKNNIHISKTIEDNIFIECDPAAADRMINRLLSNAYKFTNSRIDIELKKDGESVIFSVKDNGKGISENHKKQIFLPFFQISHEKNNTQGIGMGLYITKQIIDSLSDDIIINNIENQGTEFKIVLKHHILSEGESIIQFIPEDLSITSTKTAKATDSEYINNRPNLLLVEDCCRSMKWKEPGATETWKFQ